MIMDDLIKYTNHVTCNSIEEAITVGIENNFKFVGLMEVYKKGNMERIFYWTNDIADLSKCKTIYNSESYIEYKAEITEYRFTTEGEKKFFWKEDVLNEMQELLGNVQGKYTQGRINSQIKRSIKVFGGKDGE